MVSIQHRWSRVSARLGVPPNAPTAVLATLAGLPDFDDLLKRARKSARRNALKKEHKKHVEKYLLATLSLRVAIENDTISQSKTVE